MDLEILENLEKSGNWKLVSEILEKSGNFNLSQGIFLAWLLIISICIYK